MEVTLFMVHFLGELSFITRKGKQAAMETNPSKLLRGSFLIARTEKVHQTPSGFRGVKMSKTYDCYRTVRRLPELRQGVLCLQQREHHFEILVS